MSTNKTPNLHLHSWVPTDPFKMKEFNENFTAIDAAVASKAEGAALSAVQSQLASVTSTANAAGNCRAAFGSYVGTGKAGQSNPTTLTFDFTPKVLLISSRRDPAPTLVYLEHIAATYVLCYLNGSVDNSTATWVKRGGGSVSYYAASNPVYQFNSEGVEYYYIALA